MIILLYKNYTTIIIIEIICKIIIHWENGTKLIIEHKENKSDCSVYCELNL